MDAESLSYPMDGNDQAGDCVVAGYDHFKQVVTQLLTGRGKNLTLDEIEELYRTQNPNFRFSGDPRVNGPGSNADNGMVIQLLLELLQKRGYILGFAKVNHTNHEELKAAIYLSLGVVVGVALDVAQQRQEVWDYVPGSPSWGGHCVVLVDYLATRIKHVSWGRIYDMTFPFIDEQMWEAWFVIVQEQVNNPSFHMNYDLPAFAAAFEQLTGRKFPVNVTPPQPTEDSFHFTVPRVGVHVAEVAADRGLSVSEYVTRHFAGVMRIR